MLHRDYLMRMIERGIAAIARALGLLRGGHTERALEEIGDAYDAVLKFDRSLLRMLDARTLASMIGDDQLVRLVARISKVEGDVHEERGAPAEALACFRLALELYGIVGVGNERDDLLTSRSLTERFGRGR